MSVQSEINRITTAVSTAYSSVTAKGGTLPSSRTIGNLATAISSIPSGGQSINVVEYESSFPATADEDTIGVIPSSTGYSLNEWYVGPTAPDVTDGLQTGYVWVKTGSSSTTPIDIGEDGSQVIVCPCAAYELFVSGTAWTWTPITGKCYQNGEWKSWDKLIYDNGTLYQTLTFTGGTTTYGGSYILTEATNKNTFYTSALMDVSPYSTLKMTVQVASAGGTATRFSVGLFSTTSATCGTYPDVGYTKESIGISTSVFTISYSLTQTGSYYAPGGYIYSGNGTPSFKIYKIWLEP